MHLLELQNISNLTKRIRLAIDEDVKNADITSESIFSKNHNSKAFLIAKQDGVIAGLKIVSIVLNVCDGNSVFKALVKDGDFVKKGTVIGNIDGLTLTILKAERTLLNILQHLSAVATLTYQFVKETKNTKAVILDTRKTTPLWRDIEKYAVLAGGGCNHRIGLYDAFLIKDNHIAAAGSITNAVCRAKKSKFLAKSKFLEVEVKNLTELKEAYNSGVDRVMFDNMTNADILAGIKWLKKQKKPIPKTEASGGVNLKTVKNIAKTGVDFISVGAITHSAPAMDISLLIETINE